MLVLSKLHNILSQILAFPELHTAVLLTVSGELVSYAAEPTRSKDDIRVIAGLASEIWHETKEQGHGMVDSEKFGRIVVVPVDDEEGQEQDAEEEDEDGVVERQPLMLLALNGYESLDFDELHERGTVFAKHLAKPLSRFRPFLKVKATPPTPAALSPAPVRI
ncbi:hypothetical protein CC1G_00493 [Coprinopsis cinerea okayama7|uniref:Roadblock/LAMTOR2 domain-containing protein n=1 Tax=Coprinopsis cinerea (strain Okayama-7 / 130 / ATCC MYA-4618 / FGSC 9003) TaxID=240176 RepID=A8N369_COPC7|nr:hypothetical protein CC1G_00493 [Coprinopsis cinerea okayama7\|eukprot:XP_001829314.1 hypothetical protein CC1G_00493 [Coprinopsis cinerea okayama7\